MSTVITIGKENWSRNVRIASPDGGGGGGGGGWCGT